MKLEYIKLQYLKQKDIHKYRYYVLKSNKTIAELLGINANLYENISIEKLKFKRSILVNLYIRRIENIKQLLEIKPNDIYEYINSYEKVELFEQVMDYIYPNQSNDIDYGLLLKKYKNNLLNLEFDEIDDESLRKEIKNIYDIYDKDIYDTFINSTFKQYYCLKDLPYEIEYKSQRYMELKSYIDNMPENRKNKPIQAYLFVLSYYSREQFQKDAQLNFKEFINSISMDDPRMRQIMNLYRYCSEYEYEKAINHINKYFHSNNIVKLVYSGHSFEEISNLLKMDVELIKDIYRDQIYNISNKINESLIFKFFNADYEFEGFVNLDFIYANCSKEIKFILEECDSYKICRKIKAVNTDYYNFEIKEYCNKMPELIKKDSVNSKLEMHICKHVYYSSKDYYHKKISVGKQYRLKDILDSYFKDGISLNHHDFKLLKDIELELFGNSILPKTFASFKTYIINNASEYIVD